LIGPFTVHPEPKHELMLPSRHNHCTLEEMETHGVILRAVRD